MINCSRGEGVDKKTKQNLSHGLKQCWTMVLEIVKDQCRANTYDMPFCLRYVLSGCGLHIKTTSVGHSGDMGVRPKVAPQGSTPLGVGRHPDLRVWMG
jgi:hypothetical protein